MWYPLTVVKWKYKLPKHENISLHGRMPTLNPIGQWNANLIVDQQESVENILWKNQYQTRKLIDSDDSTYTWQHQSVTTK